ncbi:tryptophan synthase beta subunit-like PLP-dependent enzyme [Aspergillus saccharolyticus JOP 1030-1]|uniref:Tryptophan synthase beta subunit-like PLP-dependent enzyme n=1 Tax=Aspergillus saccharolyticus JOP 1030-1 TaxID=1450539 RepID=A0A318ZQW5_9EURO|nr:tryptophan synthase beta subunit-like PLP-dependent enzyme [Aspergillus saccharolyticus JOP 1030-1]PYH49457.1 tryptophan synthase beta subunit-like PLP-dependent enzyme [Aspergillus saccharolyticus JOP 1030-1]
MAAQRRSIYINPTPSTIVSPLATQVQAFHKQFPGYQASPLVSLPEVARELGVRAVYVKQESNRYGLPSFKVLGASWAIYRALLALLKLPLETSLKTLSERIRAAESFTLMAATEGNHGRAVAYVARQLSLQARIYVPNTMVAYTQEMIRSEGADVVVADGDYDYAVQEAARASQTTRNAILVQDTAFDGYAEIPSWIVEGYSTLMHEVEVQLQALGQQNTLVVSPAGVGSLAEAVAMYSKSRKTPATFVAVEPDTAACLNVSLKKGDSTSVITSPSIMAGMNCGTVSSAAWPVLQKLVDASVTISDYESHCAVEYLASLGVDSGPCGAASLAAIRRLKAEHDTPLYFSSDSVVVLLSTEGRRPYKTPEDVSSDDPIFLTQTLARIDSSNPTLSQAQGAGETEVVNYLSAWFAHRAIEHHRVETTPGRPSVVGIVRGTGGGKSLMFNGHVDTVTLSTYEGNGLSGHLGNKNGKEAIFGRGTLDMKAGLAAGLAALASAQRSKLAGDVLITAVADEEDASQGTMDVIAAGWRADGAVVLEPTNLNLAHAHKGFVWVELEVEGRAAHGSDPAAGIDAIMHMGLVLQALKQYQQQLPVDEVLGQASLHCGVIKGGAEVSSYPASCTLTVEFRTVPAQTDEVILHEMRNLLSQVQEQNSGFHFREPRITFSRPCQYLPDSHPLVQQMVDASKKALGQPVPVISVPFWCDAALLTQAGVPSIVLGPSGEGLHAREEWVEVESVRELTKMLELLTREFCK